MRKLTLGVAAVAVSALVLAGCQNTRLDKALSDNLPKLCGGATQIHLAFLAISATGELKQSVITKEKAAWNALQVFCADPSSVTSQTALVNAATAYAEFLRTIKEAK